MVSNPEKLLEKLDLSIPLTAVYETPSVEAFEPLVKPKTGQNSCMFLYYQNWLKGETLHLTEDFSVAVAAAGACLTNLPGNGTNF